MVHSVVILPRAARPSAAMRPRTIKRLVADASAWPAYHLHRAPTRRVHYSSWAGRAKPSVGFAAAPAGAGRDGDVAASSAPKQARKESALLLLRRYWSRGLDACACAGCDLDRRSVALLVLPVVDEIIDHGGVGERRGVTEVAVFVLGDLAQDAPHDLARARLRQAWRELDEIGRGDRPNLLAHPLHQFLAQVFGRLLTRHQRDVGVDALPLDVVRIAYDRGFGHLGMSDQGTLDLGG